MEVVFVELVRALVPDKCLGLNVGFAGAVGILVEFAGGVADGVGLAEELVEHRVLEVWTCDQLSRKLPAFWGSLSLPRSGKPQGRSYSSVSPRRPARKGGLRPLVRRTGSQGLKALKGSRTLSLVRLGSLSRFPKGSDADLRASWKALSTVWPSLMRVVSISFGCVSSAEV